MGDAEIPTQVARSFQQSVTSGDIHLYAGTAAHHVLDDPPSFPQTGHIVQQLKDKPAVPPKTPDLSHRRERDPLSGPEFGPGEHVLNLTSPSGATYAIVHNLHALAPEHAMLVPLFGEDPAKFRPQTSGLTEEDLGAAWRVVKAYADAGREATMFFNGGPLAGASQPHLHMQFIPFQHSRPPGPEALARSLAPASPTTPSRLPLPWVNFYLPLPSASPSPASLHRTYRALLSARDALLASLPSSALPPAGPKRDSHNVFLTSTHMHLVPRTDRLVRVPRVESRAEGEGEEFGISLNGLIYLGYWYAATEAEWRDMRTLGLAETLRRAAYANEEYEELRENGAAE
ncbi:hypothetical protein JCM10449v2_008198 [Rhodotorula kratochvilovae]